MRWIALPSQPHLHPSSVLSRQASSARILLSAVILLSCVWPGNRLAADLKTDAEEFEAIFGKPVAEIKTRTLYVPFVLDGRARPEIQATIGTGNDDLEIEAAPVIEAIQETVRPEIVEKLRTASEESGGSFNLRLLRSTGLLARFDEQRLELQLNIPPELKRSSTIHLSRRSPPAGARPPVAQSRLSGFLNVRGGIDHVQRSSGGAEEGVQPVRADVDGALNWHNWVLEGRATFSERAPTPWRREEVRIIRDDPARGIRYTFGDLSYPVVGFQNFRSMAGVTVARNFALQPYRVTEPRGRTTFFLRSSSTVEVLVNGRPVRTLHLESGSHDLQDFLFSSGANDVALRITDDVGRTETLRLSFFFDSRLLAQGEHEFSYSAGVPSEPGRWGPDYETADPVFSLFHRTGLTDTFTAGVNLQGTEGQQMLGIEGVWATRFGTFQPDFATSYAGGDSGYAARVGYRYYHASSPWGSAWNLSAQYRSPTFSALGNFAPFNPISWNLSTRYNQRLFWGLNGGIGGSYQIRRDSSDDQTSLNLFLSRRLGRSGTIDLSLDRRDTLQGDVENRAFLSVTYAFPTLRQRIRTSHDSLTQTSRADWYYTARNTVGGMSGNLGVQHRPDDSSFHGGARYTGYRGEFSVHHDITDSFAEGTRSDSRSRFRFGTALVYADGHFAISRPVRDSFAIITAHPHLADHEIGVDPTQNVYSAKIDAWGPAVVPDLRSYLVQNVAVTAPELPLGYDLGPGIYTLQPTYKSGTVLEVGTAATVLLRGVLQSPADGTPAALKYGEIVSLTEPEAKPVEIFTNRVGRFSVGGLRSGMYVVRIFGEPALSVEFEIHPEHIGIYDIGILQLREE